MPLELEKGKIERIKDKIGHAGPILSFQLYPLTMSILLAILTGSILGYMLERGDFCFHSTWRTLFRRPFVSSNADLLRAYLLLLLISIPLVQIMITLGWIDPWIPPFAWPAAVVGGLIFGAGMVVAQSCITGLFYKLGHGMLGTLLALATWGLGDWVAYRGLFSAWRSRLNSSPLSAADGTAATLLNFLGPLGPILLILGGAGAIFFLVRSPRHDRTPLWGWLSLGGGMGLFMGLAWLLATAGGADYTFGTSGVPTALISRVAAGSRIDNVWIPITLVSIVLGAFVAARINGTLWFRGESMRRFAELGAGGFLMGIGSGIAGGCNLGHSMVGVSLLSLGSITTTIAIIFGVFIADRLIKALS